MKTLRWSKMVNTLKVREMMIWFLLINYCVWFRKKNCLPKKPPNPIQWNYFVSKYFFYYIVNTFIQFPQFCTLNNSFFTVFNNILNILNLCIDLLSLLRNCED
jgi:hypothetical protein